MNKQKFAYVVYRVCIVLGVCNAVVGAATNDINGILLGLVSLAIGISGISGEPKRS